MFLFSAALRALQRRARSVLGAAPLRGPSRDACGLPQKENIEPYFIGMFVCAVSTGAIEVRADRLQIWMCRFR